MRVRNCRTLYTVCLLIGASPRLRADDVPISLEPRALAAAVVARNPSLEAARQAWRAAAATPAIDGASPDFMLETRIAPLSIPIGSSGVPFGVEAEASVPIVLSGRLLHARDAAAFDAQAAGASYARMRSELQVAAAQLACDAWELEAAVDVNQHHATLVEAMTGAARDAVASGRGTVDEALRLDDEAAALEAEQLSLASERDIVHARINGLLHRAPDAPLPSAVEPVLDDVAAAGSAAAGNAAAAADARASAPLVVEAERRADAAATRVALARTAWVPDVRVVGAYSSMWPDVQHQFTVGLAVELPFTDAARDASLERASAEHEAALRDVDDKRDAVAVEVRAAHAKLDEAKALLALIEKKRLPLAHRRSEGARTALGVGSGSLVDALTATKDERHVALEAARAKAEVCRRGFDILRAEGREVLP